MCGTDYAFRAAIFDLDMTLWDGSKLYPDVVQILDDLQRRNIPMYIASFHTMAADCCKYLDIYKYFNSIHYGRSQTKSQMVDDILRQLNYHPSDVVFFDDMIANILDVKTHNNVTVVHVPRGLSHKSIPLVSQKCGAHGVCWQNLCYGRF